MSLFKQVGCVVRPQHSGVTHTQRGYVEPHVLRWLACALFASGVVVLGWTSRMALAHERLAQSSMQSSAQSSATQSGESVASVQSMPVIEQPIVAAKAPKVWPTYAAYFTLVNDDKGQLLSCRGAVGTLAAAQALYAKIQTAYVHPIAECHILVDTAYSRDLGYHNSLAALLALMPQYPSALLAMGAPSMGWVNAGAGDVWVNAATPDATTQLQQRAQQALGDTGTVNIFAPADLTQESQRRVQLSKQLMAQLPARGVRVADIMRVLNLQKIEFAGSSLDIPIENRVVLTQAARWIKQHPTLVVDIRGFSDANTNLAYSMALGQQRADAIRSYWVSLGVPKAQIRTSGFGAVQPVADNVTAQGQFTNRRIEFWAYNGSDVHIQPSMQTELVETAQD